MRILRAATPPRIHLRYRLMQDGATIRAVEERLTDMNCLSDPRGHGGSRRFVRADGAGLVLQGLRRAAATRRRLPFRLTGKPRQAFNPRCARHRHPARPRKPGLRGYRPR
nr:DUF3016 domain-containing protein [Paracoccus pantotrophus]